MVEIEGYYLPEDRYYTDRNLWLKPEPDGTIRVGFNDLAQKLIGKVAFVRLMPKGKHIDKDRFFGTVESAKWVERLKMPISGTIEEINEELKRNPGLVNQDPYEAGWFVKIKPDNPEEAQRELEQLPHGDQVEEYLKKQIETFVKKKEK